MSYIKGDHDDYRFFPPNATTPWGETLGIPLPPYILDTNPVIETKSKSDGSSTDYYKIPEGSTDLIDLIEYKNMNFAIGNIFKACFRLGEKADTDRAYDLRKIIFFAQRELDRITK